ncbi:hypothetical protein [Streptomyces turgidiscabies]|uniref:Uncharacterized protein n=1 Tax=Streptomyces turgidiscabies TaxID=85558 RepID=A0ABU0RHP6_9ACTN|nr:hypothetical protein [Streptomyces turgidiscabies]MDQ0931508.1 hypothetical protein [Streptomyces turgidiscabies]
MTPASPPEPPDSDGAANPRHVITAEERAARATAERGTTATGQAPCRAGVPTGSTGRRLTGHRDWTTGGVIAAVAGPDDRAADRAAGRAGS